MFGWFNKHSSRRKQVRGRRLQEAGGSRLRFWQRVFTWTFISSTVFVASAVLISLYGSRTLKYSVGQRVEHPIYVRADFEVPDPQQTEANRKSARASTPSYYTLNASGVTFDRIRADLMRLYRAAADSETFEIYKKSLTEQKWLADEAAYHKLRELVSLPEKKGEQRFKQWVDSLALEKEYVARDLLREPRDPASTTDYVILVSDESDNKPTSVKKIPLALIVPQDNEKGLKGAATGLSRLFPFALRSTVESQILITLHDQPTIVYDRDRTLAEMSKAEEATPIAMTTYKRGQPCVTPMVIGSQQRALLQAEHEAFLAFLAKDIDDSPEHREARLLQSNLRRQRLQKQLGLAMLVVFVSIGLLVYTSTNHHRIFAARARTIAFLGLILSALVCSRLFDLHWPHMPSLVLIPCLFAGSVLAIVYPPRFAMGAICIVVVLVAISIESQLTMLATLFTGVAVGAYQLDEIRSRTKLITAGFVTAVCVMITAASGGLLDMHAPSFVIGHAWRAGGSALLAAFLVSGVLPFIERVFRAATSLTLLEWRDPTKPLLQLLAREAPGTYNHSLVLGTLAEAACGRIGANGLLAQVGALYHDIGKIPKAEYFAENQTGTINRHDNLAPTMSLLIILGHVKDGIEMAREYKLPRVMQQFIEEHHGTTVVRYFHHVASEQQPKIASGKHDREVSEAEFRYSGPRPRTKESAVIMLCDGVEGAVRALSDPTVGRIESVVHQIVNDRLSDGQLSDCDITLREVRIVEESLVKSLCSIYHGRVAYPKARSKDEETSTPITRAVKTGS